MGWKASMIIIQNSDHFTDEPALLQILGLDGFRYEGDTTLDGNIFPGDGSVSIGYYNHCIIVCDDFQLMEQFLTDEVFETAKRLITAFPGVEILAVSCISTTNFHGYSLLKNGRLFRVKALNADDGFYFNFGELLQEEVAIYATSSRIDGRTVWPLPDNSGDVYSEDQLMEDFTFGVAKRLLGVQLDNDEGDELMFETVFHRYAKG